VVKGRRLCGQSEIGVVFLSFSNLRLESWLKSLEQAFVWQCGEQEKESLGGVSVLDALEEERVLCDEEKIRKYIVIGYLERVTLLEELSWGQKSRALWLREGGSNAQSFSIEWLTWIGEIAPWSLCWSMV